VRSSHRRARGFCDISVVQKQSFQGHAFFDKTEDDLLKYTRQTSTRLISDESRTRLQPSFGFPNRVAWEGAVRTFAAVSFFAAAGTERHLRLVMDA
jgi:hypothetical protein